MRTVFAAIILATLSGCASERYTRHEDGGWAGRAPDAQLRIGVGYGYGWGHAGYCGPWSGPWGWSPSPWSPWNSCGAFGHSGYWGSPWYGHYPYGWYLPPRSIEGPRAGERARGLAAEPVAAPMFPRYEDLAPQRRRDTGGGDRAWSARGAWPSAPSASSSHGLGSSRGGAVGLSGSVRSAQGGFGATTSARSFSSPQSASRPSASAGSAARSASRESREEQ